MGSDLKHEIACKVLHMLSERPFKNRGRKNYNFKSQTREKKWPVTGSLFKCSTQILKIMSFEKIKLQFASHLKLKESKDKIEQ